MYTLGQILDHVEPLHGYGSEGQVTIPHFTNDSREVKPGSLFVAVKGGSADGHKYLHDVLQSGASAVIYQKDCFDPLSTEPLVKVPLIGVEDTRMAYAELASFWYSFPARDMTLIGVTGTNGKTTVTWLLEELLAKSGLVVGVIGTVNYRIRKGEDTIILEQESLTTPDALSLHENLATMRSHGVTHVVMEVASHGIHQKRVAGLEFDVAVFTNLSRDHLDYHVTLEDYFSVKKQLFTELLKKAGTAVIVTEPAQTDSTNWGRVLSESLKAEKVLTCGFDPGVDILASGIQQTVRGTQCKLKIVGSEVDFTSHLTGSFNVLNLLAAAGVGHALGYNADQITSGLSSLENVPGRMERVSFSGDYANNSPTVFIDYAHTPDALENALRTVAAICEGRLVCVFGCGGDRDRGKRSEMGMISADLADVSIVTSDNPRSEKPERIIDDIVTGFTTTGVAQCSIEKAFSRKGKSFSIIIDRSEAIKAACRGAREKDCVLIAGKGHESYQLVGKKTYFFDDKLVAMDSLMDWNKDSLVTATKGEIISQGFPNVLGKITTDSRNIEHNDVFVALKGDTFDGHDFIHQAIEKGSGAVVVEEDITPPSNVLTIRVQDTLVALGDLARYKRRLLGHRLTVVGITGSSGKTTVKEMTAAIFSTWYENDKYDDQVDYLLKTQGNFNNLIGLPLSLLPVSATHRAAILEMGMNQHGEIEKLTAICEPDIGCITNVQAAHLLGVGDINGVAAAKGELFHTMHPEATRVVNFDDPNVRKIAKNIVGKQIGFAVSPKGRKFKPLVRATRIVNAGEKGTRFTLHVGEEKLRIHLRVPGVHNVSNASAAAAIAVAAGIPLEIIKKGVELYTSFDKRMHLQSLPGGINIINDAYNANPSSMSAALQTLSTFGKDCKRIAILGDMLELGKAAIEKHQSIGELAANSNLDALAVYGDHASDIRRGAFSSGFPEKNIHQFKKHQDIATWLYHLITNGAVTDKDWILVKGSRGMRMETVIELLEELLTPK